MLQKRFIHISRPIFNKLLTPLTHIKHGDLKRNSIFSKISSKDIEYFKTVLASNNIIYDADPESTNIIQYNTDWFNLYRGSSSLCLFPTSTDQVSKILTYCNQHRLAVVPQGGNTGVSGGAIPVFDEIIINTSKLNKIRHFDSVSGVVVVDAGVILEGLDQFLETHGYTVPLDLGAKGSCQLGGNVSTNAGGLRLMRFGSLHGNQLFIGAEGTLGLITGISLLTPKRPKAVNVAMIALESFEDVQKAFVMAKENLSEILSAFEFWDHDSVDIVKSQMMQDTSYPIQGKYAFYALLETQGSRQEHDQEKLDGYLAHLLETDIAKDGVMAQDAKQMNMLWSWREKIPESITKSGTAMTYDVAMEVPLLYKMVEDAREYFGSQRLLGDGKLYSNLLGFGHVGDGNLHIMANLNEFHKHGQETMDEYVFSWAMKHNGSITAEHGVGISKVNYMNRAKSPVQLGLMRAIKNAIDPNGIMNPYKVIPK
ncbi:FAD linked oxidase [Cokeromyces recurvatus]|uniref:FAD linked oxidase n=1 Tax=Cokeromyces recurvatus TaxID=90255 RepID=UPI0022212286|nr:FAD linked oxidase [Cokeromyces recurvatus]KAI7904808.1 FAD linked oxidase [Cokeromyces recurvatus]